MTTPIEHDNPATLWKVANAFVRKQVPSNLQPRWLGLAGRANAFIVRPPRPPATTLAAKLHNKFRGPPFNYTHFRWEEDGEWRSISRSELCTAYLHLCDDYNGLRRGLAGLERLARDNDTVSVKKELSCRAKFARELEVIRARGNRYLPRLKWAAEYMSQYLGLLNRCEEHNRHPATSAGTWERYRRAINEKEARLRDAEEVRKLFWSGNMDDYPFRAAVVVNKTETPEGVQVLRKEIERVALEILRFRGCKDAETRVWRYMPKRVRRPQPGPSTEATSGTKLNAESATANGSDAKDGTDVAGSAAPPAYAP